MKDNNARQRTWILLAMVVLLGVVANWLDARIDDAEAILDAIEATMMEPGN